MALYQKIGFHLFGVSFLMMTATVGGIENGIPMGMAVIFAILSLTGMAVGGYMLNDKEEDKEDE